MNGDELCHKLDKDGHVRTEFITYTRRRACRPIAQLNTISQGTQGDVASYVFDS